MRIRNVLLGLLALGALALIAHPGFTEEEPAAPAGGDPMTAFWESLGKKNENHDWMKFMAGEWTTANKFWMGPGEPQTSTGEVTQELTMGGRYLRGHYRGEFQGTPFTGEGIMAFDNHAGAYQSLWFDSGSTRLSVSQGKRDGDKITMAGSDPSPFGGMMKTKNVLTKVSDDEYVYESYWDIPNQGEMKVMEIRYSRVK